MIEELGWRVSSIVRRTLPDPFVLAVLLTLLTAVLARTGHKYRHRKIANTPENLLHSG